MVSHAGVGHLVLNVLALAALSPRLVRGLGTDRSGWLRYAAALVPSGLCGAALYLLLHPTGAVPMVGASGAIFGVWGAAARLPPDGGDVLPIRSRQVVLEVRSAVLANLILLVPVTLLDLAFDMTGGLAWEAHLGGFLFGLLAAPHLVRRTPC
ncbi:rhomboid family intramembrane serine protease [Phenylobacterium sp. J426]|nr:rhomboid family intramembrane serine protease [Phenylobacterium sp. J426]